MSKSRQKITEEKGVLAYLETDDITRMPDQPRIYIDPADIEAKAASILTHGQREAAQVIQLNRSRKPRHQLVSGEVRWLACKSIGKPLLVRIIPTTDRDTQFEQALVANEGQTPLSIIERARAYGSLQERKEYSTSELARRMGMPSTSMRRFLNLLKLVPEAQALMEPWIPAGERIKKEPAEELAKYHPEVQRALIPQIVEQGVAKRSIPRATMWIKRNASLVAGGIGQPDEMLSGSSGRLRSPSNERFKFMTWLRHTERRSEDFLGIEGAVARMFGQASLSDIRDAITHLGKLIDNLVRLKQALEELFAAKNREFLK